MMIDIALLGTGGMMPMPERFLSSMLMRINGRLILTDCGEGTQVSLKMLGWGFKAIDTICFTHYHADHISGLPGMLLTIGNAGRTEPLRLGEAEELFKKAIEKDRTWPYSYVNLATLELQARNDYLKAFEYLEKAIQVDGTCVAAFVQRAQLYMLMQENAKASEDLEKAMAQCRTSSDLKQVCGMKISLQFQTEALEKFQQLTKAEAV